MAIGSWVQAPYGANQVYYFSVMGVSLVAALSSADYTQSIVSLGL